MKRPITWIGFGVLFAFGLPALGRQSQLKIESVRNFSYERGDNRVRLRRITGTTALFFQSKLSCDVDGAPNAYHPLDDNLSLDTIDSAGGRRVNGLPAGPLEVLPSPDVVVYVNGKPYIQPEGEFKGFYVAETSYENSAMAATDPGRYLDARKIQFVVLPGGLAPEAHLGDLAIVYDPVTKKHAAAIFGDIGPSNESGEAALATLQRLGMAATDGKSSPGQFRDDLFFLVFPNTASKLEAAEPWPHPQTTIDALAEAEFAKWGGGKQIEAILEEDPQGGSIPDNAANAWIYDELASLRRNGLTTKYEFALPNRFVIDEPGHLPCAPEIVVACGSALDEIQRRIEAVEIKRSPISSLIALNNHLQQIARIFRSFPTETSDELEPLAREVARIGALKDRIVKGE